MVESLIIEIARKIGVNLSSVSIIDGNSVGALDVHLLKISSYDAICTLLVYRDDLEKLQTGQVSDKLIYRLNLAVFDLKMQVKATLQKAA